jgi:F-type H+-transporting ATPase subunit epsilon
MPAPYRLKIITRAKVAFDGDVESVIAPGALGAFGIWADHAPLISALAPGRLWFRDAAGRESTYRVTGGYLEVRQNVVSILTDGLGEP